MTKAPADKLRVLLAVPDLQDLGVQHDVRCLMRHWDRERFEPAMLLHRREGAFADQFGPELASVEVDPLTPLDVRGARVATRLVGYVRALRRFRPHAVIAFVPYSNLACAWARPLSGVPFGLAVSEHAHVTASLRDPESFYGPFLWYYRRNFATVYNRRADLVKCIAEESLRDLVENHGIEPSRTRLIHNPVELDEVRALGAEPVDHPWFSERTPVIVNVGRLAGQKRQDLLLRAFAQVRKTRDVRLALVGRGAHEERLRALAAALGVAEHVVFLGFQRNPWKYLSRAAALALSSDWEGLPCVLTEAMALGIPIVSTRCPSGPTEMLLDGKAGLLVPVNDADALAAALGAVLDDPAAARARAGVATAHLQRFAPEPVTRQYEALAEELAGLRGFKR